MPIHFKKPGLGYALDLALSIANQCIIISTNSLASLMPNDSLCFLLPDGEEGKSFNSYLLLIQFLEEKKFERGDVLIAFGGGALLDVVGFAASTYLRGTPFISVPTTLLSMSDACLGGKTGINFEGFKNRIGAFYSPKEIIIDPTYLETLSNRAKIEGMAEIVKHGLIASSSLFSEIEKSCLKGKDIFASHWLKRSLEIKHSFVERDPHETTGVREALNFGHTVGHALEEKLLGKISHGAAVWYGMRVEITHSYLTGVLNEDDYFRFIRLYDMMIGHFPFDQLEYALLKKDKKSRRGVPRIVKIEKIGELACLKVPSFPLSLEEFKEAWDETVCAYQKPLHSSG
jgi:3-dehydroquinate synthase